MAAHSYCPVGTCRFVATAETLRRAEALLRDHRAAEHGDVRFALPLLEAGFPAWSQFFPDARLPTLSGLVLPLCQGPKREETALPVQTEPEEAP